MNVKEPIRQWTHPSHCVQLRVITFSPARQTFIGEKCLFIKFVFKLAACLALAASLSMVCGAQETTPANSESSSPTQPKTSQEQSPTQIKDPSNENPPAVQPQQPSDKSKENQDNQNGTSKDRLFFALPNFLTLENAGHVAPLTAKQKFGVVARGSFDPVIFAWYGFLSTIAQAENSEPAYGQGWEGFGKRYATNFADGTIENFMTGAIMPTILRQDPRYFQMGHGSFTHRTLYSMSRNIITLSDSGKKEFNCSEVCGGALSAVISTYGYHPKGRYVTTTTPGVLHYIPSDRTLPNTLKVWGTQYAYDTLTLVVREFWPDIRRAMVKHKGEARFSTGE